LGCDGVPPLYSWRQPARSCLSHEHEIGWGRAFCPHYVSLVVCSQQCALGKGERYHAWATTRLSCGGTQSILFIGSVLHRPHWNSGIPVPWCCRFFTLQQQLRAAARPTGTKVVSTIQRKLAGEFLGGNGTIYGLSGTIRSCFG